MDSRRVVNWMTRAVVIVLALLGAEGRAQARGDSRDQVRAIEGVWQPMVTIFDCQTQAVITTFPSMEIYVRGGGYVGFGAVTQSDQVGMGKWSHLGGRRFSAEYQFFNYTPFGAPGGTPDGTILRVRTTIRLNTDGTAFTASDTADVLDPNGNSFGRVCGSRQAKRLQ